MDFSHTYKTSNQEYGNFSRQYSNSNLYSFNSKYLEPYKYEYNSYENGLPNVGNTCYINSALQCLFQINKLNDFILSEKFENYLGKSQKQSKIAISYRNLLKKIKTNYSIGVTDAYEFKKCFDELNEAFNGYEQQDSQEFLRVFLDNLHEALNQKNKVSRKKPNDFMNGIDEMKLANEWWEFNLLKDNSIISNIFSGQFISTLKCSYCGNISKCFDNFWDLSLSFKTFENKFTINWEDMQPVHLEKLLDCFMQQELIETKCEKCKKTSQKIKSLNFSRVPDILCIHLKRFEYCDGYKRKIKKEVIFPKEKLDLRSYIKKANFWDSSFNYNLIGIVHHYGEVNYGHYIAECKNSKKWNVFDDSIVSESNLNHDGNEASSSTAYILFYEKIK